MEGEGWHVFVRITCVFVRTNDRLFLVKGPNQWGANVCSETKLVLSSTFPFKYRNL